MHDGMRLFPPEAPILLFDLSKTGDLSWMIIQPELSPHSTLGNVHASNRRYSPAEAKSPPFFGSSAADVAGEDQPLFAWQLVAAGVETP